ncbi:vasoactive intestinal polypeptide receptor 2 isoform X3 [Panthera pardus]|uniref:Vasoactive intestinal polypeptide receptor 2 isoform X3 n=1 Tax=Panthera pardus TaxID=9691 RepID=A0A9W2V7K9_PANPR|nr:vasoactive intestinal polypeptide receptor 2 isoform X3 [Panthera pardus]
MRAPALLPPALLTCCGWLLAPVNSVHPECRFHLEIQEEETKCAELLRTQTEKYKGNISKNCTSDGWSEMFPDFVDACGYNDPEDESKIAFYVLVKAIYTLGYSVSLISLTTGSIILCLFRKLHCTRNYIHLNLFLSFILRAISVLVKDDILYSSSGTLHCPDQPSSWVGCKLSLVLFQYCIMANFYWLLVEGLYLHTLLVAIFSPGRRFVAYLLIGWGIPTICTGAWTAARLSLEDTGCWDTNDHSVPWWVIRTPILISIIVNFVLFVSIIRILLQKLTSPDVGGNDQSQYRRLTKSTLLLIPLFGVHYMVFAVFPIGISSKYQILFELCIGSFQGLVVAVLYCFLNSEVRALSQQVQSELKRKWRGWCPSQPCGRDHRFHGSSVSRNGSESALQLHRGSCAPSFLQTETSVI